MKKMKRVLSLVLALCFALALVGCGGGGLKTGKYTISSLMFNGIDAVAAAKAQGKSVDSIGYLEIKDSKNATMVIQGQSYQLTYDSKKFYVEGNSIGEYKASGNTISFPFTMAGMSMELSFTK
ncbi:MAG: hypothetical protein IK125_02655 [Lachnospiraceae bacterium]|nr:hypothetical protein [Lachnospiraceae bacterium]